MSAREVGVSSRPAWVVQAERGSAAALRLAITLFRALGRRTGLLRHPIVVYFMLADGPARRASRQYFERLASTPEGREMLGHAPGWRDTYQQLFEFSTSILDRICVWAGKDQGFEFRHRGADHFAHLPEGEAGRRNSLGKCGALVVGAHLGTFDMMRSICLEARVPVHGVFYGGNAETFNHFLKVLNPKHDMGFIHVRPDAIGSALEIHTAIERGDFVAIMGDRVHLSGRGTHEVSFFGAPARFSEGPFQLAALIGCPVILATALRVGDAAYEVHSEPLYAGGRVPRAERAKVVHEMIEAYARSLERLCLRAPWQWFNFFDFWAVGEGPTREARSARDETPPSARR
jgi:predicted LPLAT superfamily acyltransferase